MLITTADNNKDSESGDLVSQLDQLVEFQDYFKDKEKVSVLVDWIHEETGINKMAARLAVKHIAPFLLARLANLGQAVSKAWMNKLHDKLSQYNCYTGLVSNLVNILKTRTDKSFEQALNIPSEDNLNQLLEKQRWSNLKPEQQGLVRLMLGQQHANQ